MPWGTISPKRSVPSPTHKEKAPRGAELSATRAPFWGLFIVRLLRGRSVVGAPWGGSILPQGGLEYQGIVRRGHGGPYDVPLPVLQFHESPDKVYLIRHPYGLPEYHLREYPEGGRQGRYGSQFPSLDVLFFTHSFCNYPASFPCHQIPHHPSPRDRLHGALYAQFLLVNHRPKRND